MDNQSTKKPETDSQEFSYGDVVDMRAILENAIKMQALYSDGRIKFVEASNRVN